MEKVSLNLEKFETEFLEEYKMLESHLRYLGRKKPADPIEIFEYHWTDQNIFSR